MYTRMFLWGIMLKKTFLFLFFIILFNSCVDLEDVDHSKSFKMTSNVDDWREEVIYQVLTDRFFDGDYSNNYNVDINKPGHYHGGDWQGIIDKMDYIKTLGVTAIWISPVVKNLETDAGFYSYHGYWTQDFKSVNPHFGNMAKLREMVKVAHKNGIKVILDIVANHIGQLFYYDINGNNQPDDYFIGGNGEAYGSDNKDFPSPLTRTSEWDPEYDSRGVQAFSSLGESDKAPIYWIYDPSINRVPPMPIEFQNKDWYNRRGRVTVWAFENDACRWILKDQTWQGYWWNEPKCRAYIMEQSEKGDFPGGLKDLDTTRQDVKEALTDVFKYWIEMADFDGFRIDTVKHVEHEFWKYFAKEIRDFTVARGKNHFLLFGEVFDGNDELVGSYTKNNELDSTFYFPQKFVLEGVVKGGAPTCQLSDLYKRRMKYYCTGASCNKDTNIIHGVYPTSLLVNFLDNHDVGRWLWSAPGKPKVNQKALHVALMYQLTIDGIPCIYYGTEQNYKGGNDPANREDLTPSHFDTTNTTFKLIQTLIKIRKLYEPLTKGVYNILYTGEESNDGSDWGCRGVNSNGAEENAGIFAFERVLDNDKVLVVINFNSQKESTATFSTTLDGSLKNVFPDKDSNDSFSISNGEITISVPARGIKILVPSSKVKSLDSDFTYNPDLI